MPDFSHLHVHTHYSLLDGAASIRSLITKARENGMDAIAMTDHGNLYGVVEFFREARAQGIKPIIGCEMYVADGSRFDRKGREDRSGYHLILLAKNLEGYYNLCRLSSLGFLEGFYYTPRIDKELLRKYSAGLIASTACLGGEVPSAILDKGEEKAAEVLEEYMSIFGKDLYLELQRHGLADQDSVNPVLVRLAEKYDLKIIATNDVHFANSEEYEAHKILICLNTGKDLDAPDALAYTGNEYLKSPEEMASLFHDLPEAISNTREVVDKIEDFTIEQDVILPIFPLPEGFDDADEYLRHLTYEGAGKKYGTISEDIRQRIDYELSVIKDMGFAGYFLIVQDFIAEARKMGVLVGPGRGSAAGSAVAYCTGITSIDPIKYNLLFERFLNPERVSMPDIDIDFDDEGRDRVIRYVVEKYGDKRVAQIVTFGTMAARSSIRDVARVMKLPLDKADRLAKLVPQTPGMDLRKAFSEVKELQEELRKGDEKVKKTLEFARVLEGSARHTGTHACGVIIGADDLIDRVPLSTAKDTEFTVIQYEGKYVQHVGMLKMDFLGLKTLSIIKDTVENIRLRHGTTIDVEELPLDDLKTYELFQRADTIGIFQFESDGMRNYLRRLKPTSIEDLIAMNALFRPGPMEQIPTYIARKHGKERIEYPHKMLEDILRPTYGIMIYQEQIMQAALILAGFSLGKADLLRKAMGKKDMLTMEKQKNEFIEGAVSNNIEKEKAGKIFDLMMEFANYGFNRSHSAAYAILAYRTAYLKAYYPAEFMAAILTHNLDNISEITFFIEECKRLNIEVLGPDINESDLKFSVNAKGEIRFGLAAIKGIGKAAVEAIIEERKNGSFSSLFEFVKRINLRTVNRKSIESLAMAGAFDSFEGLHRAMFFHKEPNEEISFIEKVIRHAGEQQSRKRSSQQDLFGNSNESMISDPALPLCPAWSKLELLQKEKEVTGFYISGHPMEDFKTEIRFFTNTNLAELSDDLGPWKDKEVRFAGMVTSVNHRTSAKTGKPFGNFVLEDFFGNITLSLFSEDYLRNKHFLEPGTFIHIKGRVEARFNAPDLLEIRISQITLLAEVLEKFVNEISLIMFLQDLEPGLIHDLKDRIGKSKGKSRLRFIIRDADENYMVELPSKSLRINPAEVISQLTAFPAVEFKLN